MLFAIGSRAPHGDVADLLIACHHRIREHLALARRIATAPPSTAVESVRAAAARVRKYFAEAYALHHRDEELDLFPLLAGRSDAIDRAIAALRNDHDVFEPEVARLVAICAALEDEPASLAGARETLAELVGSLETGLVGHMHVEEGTVFPLIEQLSPHEREGILARMRTRRGA